MKSRILEQTRVLYSPQRDEAQLSSERSRRLSASPRENISKWQAGRSGVGSARQMDLRALAAETAHLQRRLADAYPELARLQRQEG